MLYWHAKEIKLVKNYKEMMVKTFRKTDMLLFREIVLKVSISKIYGFENIDILTHFKISLFSNILKNGMTYLLCEIISVIQGYDN